MPEIIVIGHRNPDTDSACAAWSYAKFKNAVDPERRANGRPSAASSASRPSSAFDNARVEPPPYLKDVRPRVLDITEDVGIRLDSNDPLKMAFEDLDTPRISVAWFSTKRSALPASSASTRCCAISSKARSTTAALYLPRRQHRESDPRVFPQARPGGIQRADHGRRDEPGTIDLASR